VAIGLMNLASAGARLDPARLPAAVAQLEEARSILLASVGPDHPLVASAEGNLGRMLHDLDRHDEALTHLRAALAVQRRRFDDDHPLLLGELSDIGRCLTDVGRYGEAETTLLQAFRGLEGRPDANARAWDDVLQRLAALYRARGDEREAARYEGLRTPGRS